MGAELKGTTQLKSPVKGGEFASRGGLIGYSLCVGLLQILYFWAFSALEDDLSWF